MTHPSPDGQEAVIRRAYERAGGLDPRLTGQVEVAKSADSCMWLMRNAATLNATERGPR